MKLKPYQQRLISHCLDIAADEFSNHGCNDFDLDTEGFNLTDKQKRELVLGMALENGDECEIAEVREDPSPKYTTDWRVMRYFSRMVYLQEETPVEPEPEGEEVARLKRRVKRLEDDVLLMGSRLSSIKNKMREVVNNL